MVYHSTDADGISEINPKPQRMRAILESVKDAEADAPHPDVWLTHDDSGWMLTYSSAQVMVLENLDNDVPPRYLRDVSLNKAFEMWQCLAQGEIKPLFTEPWERERD